MANTTSPHILSTSANLLGFCLVVITSLHITNKSEVGILDELTSLVAVLLIFSCLFSFFSIRTTIKKREVQLESIADYFFIASLIGILIVIAIIALNFMN
jgi:hypothetical protein